MRDDNIIKVVIQKCEVLQRSGMWPSSPRIRPAAWLGNFLNEDKRLAALLLDRFVYCDEKTVNSMLQSAWNSIGDGFPKGTLVSPPATLLNALKNAVITPIEGESPSPTDSGNLICRKARQVLGIPDSNVKTPAIALEHAIKGNTIVFFDDFIGSGDQFLTTWSRTYPSGHSFQKVQNTNNFTAIYITLVTTDFGLNNIQRSAPKVAVCPAHTLDNKSNLFGLIAEGIFQEEEILSFLKRYSRITQST